MKLLFLLLILCINNSYGNLFKQLQTTVTPEQVELEGNPEYLTNLAVKIFKGPSGKILLNITTTLIKTFPEDLRIKISLFLKKDSGEYIQYGRSLESVVCNFINNDKLFYPGILRKSNMVKQCPVIPGDYYVANYAVPVDNLPPIPEAAGRAEVLFTHGEEVLCKVLAFGKIEKSS